MSLSYSERNLAPVLKVPKPSKITKALYRKHLRRMLNKRISTHFMPVKENLTKKSDSPQPDHRTSKMVVYTEQICANTTERFSSPESAASSLTDLLSQPLLFVPATELTYESEKAVMRAKKPIKVMRSKKSPKVMHALHWQRKTLTGRISKEWPVTNNNARIGLRNQGAVCYRRAVMQALLNVPIFVNWAASIAEKHSDPKNALSCPTEGCTVCAFSNVADAAWTGTRATLASATRLFDSAVRGWHGRGLVARETWMRRDDIHTDAREFFMALIGVLQGDPMLNSPSPIVEGLFSLRLRQESICPRCKFHQVSPPEDEMTPLIQLHDERSIPHKDPIAALFSTKISKMACGHCGFVADRVCTKYIEAAPEILVLAINVFTIDKRGIGRKNESAHLDYPQNLDLSRFASTGEIRPLRNVLRYRLSSIICHSGSVRSGHYVNYSVNPESGVHMYDDFEVRKRSEKELLGGERFARHQFTPYVLTYVSDASVVCNGRNI